MERGSEQLRQITISVSEDSYKNLNMLRAKHSAQKGRLIGWDEFCDLIRSEERRKETAKSWLYTAGIFVATTIILMPFALGAPQIIPILLIIGAAVAAFSAYILTPWSLRGLRPFDTAPASLKSALQELSGKCGLKSQPTLTLAETPEVNAITYVSLSGARICLTRGIIEAYEEGYLDDDDMRAILGHELGHVKNLDNFKWALVLSWVSIFDAIGHWTTLIGAGLAGAGASLAVAQAFRRDKDTGWSGLIMLAVGLSLLAIGYATRLAAKLVSALAFHLSRKQEYLADEVGAELTSAHAMTSALAKIEMLNQALAAQAVDSLPYADRWQATPLNRSRVDSLWDTHPATENRVAALDRMAELI